MSKIFKDVSALQVQLKRDIYQSIQGTIADLCTKVVKEMVDKKVYQAYMPKGDYAYERTNELMNSVTIGNFKLGTKYATFEIYMDTEKIGAYETEEDNWNQHADVDYEEDVSDYIPMWVEEGTSGSLWDRNGAHYMEQSTTELDKSLYQALAQELRRQGWEVKVI
ncbi:hypothetical protein [Bacillus gaemokensis]|uniref:HK97 gp10 family phage protein n=1 Tax=Bacillus gaemokensis TaxID=574375 RepID=A0A073KBS1_9BACI|nr:hypothetical protein [Bacillus gaemokensis]KEK23941.1 hypothetical protein BAGA_05850 [Bacillus gaemokensis]KYG38063.1 hypothetical protein AZF08_20095 [Bacillus gaemokensis]